MANGPSVGVILRGSVKSTPRSDPKPAVVSSNELEQAIHQYNAAVSNFASSIIKDPKARLEYIRKSQEYVSEVKLQVQQKQLTPHEAAQATNAMRNQLMEIARLKLSNFGLITSQGIKKTGKTLDELQDKYAQKLFKRAFQTLNDGEKSQVWMEIVRAAGSPQQKMTNAAKWYGRVGKGLIVLATVCAIYNIVEAEDKVRQTAKEGTVMAAGVLGGLAAGAGIAFVVSNPVGWIVGVAMLGGGAAAAFTAESIFDHVWVEK